MKLFIATHAAIYRLTGGRVMGSFGKAPILLLMTKGRKSGKTRTTPLLYLEENGAYFVVASAGGSPTHPGWYWNLKANPAVRIQMQAKTMNGTATTVDSDTKSRIWPRFTAMYPEYDAYQEKTKRDIPVVKLVPQR